MALGDTSNVLAGLPASTGGLWVADKLDKTKYADIIGGGDLKAAGFNSVGYITEDGVTEASERDTEKVKAWGGDTIRVLQNEHTATFTFAFAELANPEVLRLVYGDDNVTVQGANISINQNSKTLPHKSFVIEVLDGTKKIRKFIPDGQITETGELQMVHSNVMQVEVTLEAFPDHEGNKVYTTYKEVGGAAPGTVPVPEEDDGEPDGEGLEEGEPDGDHAEE